MGRRSNWVLSKPLESTHTHTHEAKHPSMPFHACRQEHIHRDAPRSPWDGKRIGVTPEHSAPMTDDSGFKWPWSMAQAGPITADTQFASVPLTHTPWCGAHGLLKPQGGREEPTEQLQGPQDQRGQEKPSRSRTPGCCVQVSWGGADRRALFWQQLRMAAAPWPGRIASGSYLPWPSGVDLLPSS